MDTIICTICFKSHPLSQFHKRSDSKTGRYDRRCKPCRTLQQRRVREAMTPEQKARRKLTHQRWVKANKERYRVIARSSQARSLAALKAIVYEVLGDCCARCGFTDKRALQIDHIHGDSKADRDEFGTFSKQYLKKVVSLGTSNYQILCANCNWIKRHEEGNHPTPFLVVAEPSLDPLYRRYKQLFLHDKEDAA